jgi:hypothetical protein
LSFDLDASLRWLKPQRKRRLLRRRRDQDLTWIGGVPRVGAPVLLDTTVYIDTLQGRKLGWPVVTGNIADFDFLNQLVPDGRILLYRRME